MALFQEESLWSEMKWILYLPSIHFFFLDLIIFHVHPSKKSKVTQVLWWFLLERVVSTWHIQVWISLVGVLFASYLKWLNFPIQRLGVLPIMLWKKKTSWSTKWDKVCSYHLQWNKFLCTYCRPMNTGNIYMYGCRSW